MGRNVVLGFFVVALCGASSPALADWTGKGELGASFASGNSENESVNAVLGVKNAYDQWTHTLGFAGNYGNDGTDTTAQRWEVRGQSDYEFTEKTYWFGAGRYEDDRFSAYDYQASLSTGLGYRIIDNDRTKLWVQGGPGYRYAELRETGESEDVQALVTALEAQYDAFVESRDTVFPLGGNLPTADELGAEFEKFLADRGRDFPGMP